MPSRSLNVFTGRLANEGQRQRLEEGVGRKILCVMAFSDMSGQVEKSLAQNPPQTNEQAIEMAASVLADGFHLATRQVAQEMPAVMRPEVTVGDNGGSTRPYAPIADGMSTFDAAAGTQKITGQKVSQLAISQGNVTAIAVTGIYSYTTRPVDGYVLTYDGHALSLTKGGRIWYDANTLAGRQGKVDISGSAAYSASINEDDSKFRMTKIRETSRCALAINDVASQVAGKFMAPDILPSPDSTFAHQIIIAASIKSAFGKAASGTAGTVEQDLSASESVWRIGDHVFLMAKGGIKVAINGQPYFDESHISGRGFTVRAILSNSVSGGYKK